MNNNFEDLYQQIILDHSQGPHNFFVMPNPDRSKKGFNPLCGDQLTLYLKIDENILKDISFSGSGCAISIASASLMTDLIKGKKIEEIIDLFQEFQELATTGTSPHPEKLNKLRVLANISKFPMRVKCATLAWHTLKQILNDGIEH